MVKITGVWGKLFPKAQGSRAEDLMTDRLEQKSEVCKMK